MGAVETVAEFGARVQAEAVVERGGEVAGRDRILVREGAGGVDDQMKGASICQLIAEQGTQPLQPPGAALRDETRRIWDANATFWDAYYQEGNTFHKVLIEPAVEMSRDRLDTSKRGVLVRLNATAPATIGATIR